MPTLKMETQEVRNLLATLNASHHKLLDEMTNMNEAVGAVTGVSWIGNSANEFESQFQRIAFSMGSVLEQLASLNRTLNNEINQWETTGQMLG